MTTAAPYEAPAAARDDWAGDQPLQEDDTVRCGDNPDDCKVLGTWSGWLWLYPLDLRSAPFTARASDCSVVRRAEAPRWPSR